MTATTAVQDWLSLKARIDTLVTDPVLPRFEPNAAVTPPAGLAPFLLISDVRNDNDRNGWVSSDLNERSGTLILAVQWPLAAPVLHVLLMQIGGTIADHFPADLCMGRLRVTRNADVLQPYVEGAYRVVVVRVLWSSV